MYTIIFIIINYVHYLIFFNIEIYELHAWRTWTLWSNKLPVQEIEYHYVNSTSARSQLCVFNNGWSEGVTLPMSALMEELWRCPNWSNFVIWWFTYLWIFSQQWFPEEGCLVGTSPTLLFEMKLWKRSSVTSQRPLGGINMIAQFFWGILHKQGCGSTTFCRRVGPIHGGGVLNVFDGVMTWECCTSDPGGKEERRDLQSIYKALRLVVY